MGESLDRARVAATLVPRQVRAAVDAESMLAQDVEVAHAVARECERVELQPSIAGEAHALSQPGLRGLARAVGIVEDGVRERVAADFLLDLAGEDAVEEALPVEDRVTLLRASRVRLE